MTADSSAGNGPVHLTVVIPAFNEEEVILQTLETVTAYLGPRPFKSEILVVDDGSRDRTAAIVEEAAGANPSIRLARNGENRGKGFSVRHGIERAAGTFVIFSDADLSTPITETEKLLSHLEAGDDIVIGSRDLPDSDVQLHQPWYRELMGKIFNRIVRILVIGGIHDTQCGFKGFRREKVLDIVRRMKIEAFTFDVEILFLAKRAGLRIREVPVIWLNNPDTRVNALTDSVRMFVDLFRIRYYHFSGQYKGSTVPVVARTPGTSTHDHQNGRE